MPGKSKKDRKKIKKEHLPKEVEHVVANNNEASEVEVYCISSGDDDCSKGMKSTNFRVSDISCRY